MFLWSIVPVVPNPGWVYSSKVKGRNFWDKDLRWCRAPRPSILKLCIVLSKVIVVNIKKPQCPGLSNQGRRDTDVFVKPFAFMTGTVSVCVLDGNGTDGCGREVFSEIVY